MTNAAAHNEFPFHAMDANQMTKTEEEWKKILTPEQYHVLREKGTEPPGSGTYEMVFEDGIYKCAACGNPLFDSKTKYDAHCGWPSFYKPLTDKSVTYHSDTTMGVERIEVRCGKCGSHLGHVFDDGPQPTGKRFCMNSVSLDLGKRR